MILENFFEYLKNLEIINSRIQHLKANDSHLPSEDALRVNKMFSELQHLYKSDVVTDNIDQIIDFVNTNQDFIKDFDMSLYQG